MTAQWETLTEKTISEESLHGFLAASGSNGRGFTLQLARRPDFFEALAVEGKTSDVFGVRDNGKLRAIAVRSEKDFYFNGNKKPETLGSLGGLSIAPEARGGSLLYRGYAYLRDLHKEGDANAYLTTILSSNTKALNLLSSGRGNLPEYRHLGQYETCFVKMEKYSKPLPNSCSLSRACKGDIPAVQRFIEECSLSRNFVPYYSESDLLGGRLLKDFDIENLLLLHSGGHIVGSLGVWDQRRFRQWHVQSPYLKRSIVPRMYNALQRFHGLPVLAGEREPLSIQFGVMPLVREGFEEAFSVLLTAAATELRQRDPGSSFIVGLHERDPLLPILNRFAARKLQSEVYLVSWPDKDGEVTIDQTLVPYLELGAL